MNYTKEQLQGMSDTQILKRLYQLLGYTVIDYEYQEVITIRDGKKVTTAELCCDDIMPLAFEYGISFISLSDGYMASKCEDIYMEESYRSIRFCDPGDMEFADKNPLRAIACCLILVLQDKTPNQGL